MTNHNLAPHWTIGHGNKNFVFIWTFAIVKTNTSHLNNLLQNIFVYNSLIVTGKGEPQQYNTFSRRKHMAATIGSKIYFRIFFISFMVAAKAASCLYNTFSHIKHMATTRRSHTIVTFSHVAAIIGCICSL